MYAVAVENIKPSYSAIGRTLQKLQPEVFGEIERLVSRGEESDISRIEVFFKHFTSHRPTGVKSPVEQRRIFIGAALKLFKPYKLEKNIGSVSYGFSKKVAGLFDCPVSIVSRGICEAVVQYKTYEDYRDMVNAYYEIFKAIPK